MAPYPPSWPAGSPPMGPGDASSPTRYRAQSSTTAAPPIDRPLPWPTTYGLEIESADSLPANDPQHNATSTTKSPTHKAKRTRTTSGHYVSGITDSKTNTPAGPSPAIPPRKSPGHHPPGERTTVTRTNTKTTTRHPNPPRHLDRPKARARPTIRHPFSPTRVDAFIRYAA